VHGRHVEGLFPRAEWLRLLSEAGFVPRVVPFEHSELEPGSHEVFVAARPVAHSSLEALTSRTTWNGDPRGSTSRT
jgi:hypothetical protein